jgi:MHS family proline/betaine transporter-like MFS transporter
MRRIHLRRHRLRTSDVTVVERSTLQQAIGGTVVGNFMEWYDFGVYGYLAVTMTSVFTKGLPQNLGLLVMLLGFAVSFLVRPVGGVVLGPLGDRIGRQKVLFFTMGTHGGFHRADRRAADGRADRRMVGGAALCAQNDAGLLDRR